MNHLSKRLVSILAFCLGLVALVASPTFAQNPQTEIKALRRADIVAPPVEGQFRPDQMVVKRRPAITFKAFDVVDKTGKPTSRNTMLTLSNGKTLNAGQYWDEMNKVERGLNAEGYTLRPGPGDKPGTPKRIEVQQTPTPVATLQQQDRALSSSYIRNLKFQPLNLSEAVQRQQAMIVVNPSLLNTVGVNLGTPLHVVKNYDKTFGDSSTLAVSLNGKLELDGTSTSTSLDAEANASSSLLSHSFDILQLSGKLTSPQKGPLNVNVNASVLGSNVYNLNHDVTSTFSKSDHLSKTFDQSVTVARFTILVIPMSVKIGIQGTAGFQYAVTVAPLKATGTFAPSIKSSVYAQVGVDVVVASAGVGGRLVLLNLDGNLDGGVAIVPAAGNKLNYGYNLSYQQTIDTLDGDLYAFVTVGDCDFFGFCHQFDHSFFSYTGIKSSGYLFNESKTVPVFGQVMAEP
jgi:hypothetical protein